MDGCGLARQEANCQLDLGKPQLTPPSSLSSAETDHTHIVLALVDSRGISGPWGGPGGVQPSEVAPVPPGALEPGPWEDSMEADYGRETPPTSTRGSAQQ